MFVSEASSNLVACSGLQHILLKRLREEHLLPSLIHEHKQGTRSTATAARNCSRRTHTLVHVENILLKIHEKHKLLFQLAFLVFVAVLHAAARKRRVLTPPAEAFISPPSDPSSPAPSPRRHQRQHMKATSSISGNVWE